MDGKVLSVKRILVANENLVVKEMTIEGVQGDLWAKVEGTEAIYSGEEKL